MTRMLHAKGGVQSGAACLCASVCRYYCCQHNDHYFCPAGHAGHAVAYTAPQTAFLVTYEALGEPL